MANLTKIKIKGLKAACSMTKGITFGQHVQIFYDIDEGELIAIKHLNAWDHTVFHDNKILSVYDAYDKLTMLEIRDETYRKIRAYIGKNYDYPMSMNYTTKTQCTHKMAWSNMRRYGQYFEGQEERFSDAVVEAIELLEEGIPAADVFA